MVDASLRAQHTKVSPTKLIYAVKLNESIKVETFAFTARFCAESLDRPIDNQWNHSSLLCWVPWQANRQSVEPNKVAHFLDVRQACAPEAGQEEVWPGVAHQRTESEMPQEAAPLQHVEKPQSQKQTMRSCQKRIQEPPSWDQSPITEITDDLHTPSYLKA